MKKGGIFKKIKIKIGGTQGICAVQKVNYRNL